MGGIPDMIQRYSKSPLSSTLVQLLVEMMRTDPSLRPSVDECLSSSWIHKVAAEYDDSVDVIMDEDVCKDMDEDPFADGAVVDFVDAKVGEIVAGIAGGVGVQSMSSSVEGELVADMLRDAFDNFDTKSQSHC